MSSRTAPASPITGLLLAGGRGTRMGGVDKGLQPLRGEPLALHVLRRLAPQVDALVISANRHLDRYAALGAPFRAQIVADAHADFAGPLAGLAAGLRTAGTPLVLCVPCDSPFLPADLAARLAAALDAQRADIAFATTVDAGGGVAPQPVFALVRTALADDLAVYLAAGERKMRAWYARHKTVEVPFSDERAFYNANSLRDLAGLERA
ncbi:molybdenum cofactor guanylyltransferase MobA [Burkholderia thailandensis]|uniref:Molybdenum cofactor guanylyltransferase n=1 Tax=Burkholderia thailandensis (strain ATCC 700388 / DSM 13276 / CCUG 48851 / CIP 106301 / E264) TaxID=271848 RepID=Q2SXV9_BURTA|nr:molybdenum cofactor guanylyltransferase MobA [Burkholderia thailandensis]ABC37861.1 molybdopterin-guanine dinucleotide biosynthesis protein A [Burkholderia thailandensis E264]AHI72446.1 molybdopterin-guanine dinucleotide biosynthesis protein A [Burkholderia thailandensis 2002721723]AHI79516.1 molybdopterin-guanine dinucleotide biosynthesis protein A [Burkholderia thailandensis E444]AIC87662.1 molybdopterin-guanine dinucleotide biosynthesis protein A [Burkholderia thailandensis USAMRU Malaysi